MFVTVRRRELLNNLCQSINVVDDPDFRELLTYISGGACAEEDIPHRTTLTKDIIEAWKQERKVFANDMKVGLITQYSVVILVN